MTDDPFDDVLQRIAYELLIYSEHKSVQRIEMGMDDPDVWPWSIAKNAKPEYFMTYPIGQMDYKKPSQ